MSNAFREAKPANNTRAAATGETANQSQKVKNDT